MRIKIARSVPHIQWLSGFLRRPGSRRFQRCEIGHARLRSFRRRNQIATNFSVTTLLPIGIWLRFGFDLVAVFFRFPERPLSGASFSSIKSTRFLNLDIPKSRKATSKSSNEKNIDKLSIDRLRSDAYIPPEQPCQRKIAVPIEAIRIIERSFSSWTTANEGPHSADLLRKWKADSALGNSRWEGFRRLDQRRVIFAVCPGRFLKPWRCFG
jgi:hypothetical protein